MAGTTPVLTEKEEQDILNAIPDPATLKKLLDEENAEKNGRARKIAVLLFKKEITEILIKSTGVILKGEQIFIKLESEGVAKECGIEPLSLETLRGVAEEIQRILIEKTYSVSCEEENVRTWWITIQRAPSSG